MISYLSSRFSYLEKVTSSSNEALNNSPSFSTIGNSTITTTKTSPPVQPQAGFSTTRMEGSISNCTPLPPYQHPPQKESASRATLLTLPPELLLQILSHLLTPSRTDLTPFHTPDPSTFPPPTPGLHLHHLYAASPLLALLLTCRHFASILTTEAFRHTHFLIRDIFTPVPERLSVLCTLQIEALRRVSWVVGCERQVREMCAWRRWPFDWQSEGGEKEGEGPGRGRLRLEELNIVFQSGSGLLYLQDHTHKLVALLRRLDGIRKLRFIRNGANIKGSLKTFYNRLIGLLLKEDHRERYDSPDGPCLPVHWWDWHFDDEGQWFEFVAREPLGIIEESVYMEMAKPLVEELMKGMLEEEMGADAGPRARMDW